jgi:Tfp pilus assembly protein PilF
MENNTATNTKKDFFISYNKADKEWAVWIAEQLENNRYTTIIQEWDFRPGNNFPIEMDLALKNTEHVLCVLSPSYLRSEFTQPEWAAAFVQDPTGIKRKIIPVRVRPFDPDGLLPSIIYIDLVDLDKSEAQKELLKGVQEGRVKPQMPSQFPSHKSKTTEKRFPGSLPNIWNVPLNRNPHFTGRDGYMETLHTTLHSGKYAALTQALTGLGGIGKTQIAVEYTYRFASEYDVVWWIRAEDRTTLIADFLNLGDHFHIDQYESSEQRLKISLIRRWLETHNKWLLIFDNAQDLKDLYNPTNAAENFLPQASSGHILITSRNPNWSSVVHPLDIQLFSKDEAIEFLQKRTGLSDETGASNLAKELGYLPLALEQAAAFIVETPGLTFQDYVKLFNERHKQLWATEKPPINYPATVATTWSLSIDRIKKENTDSADLLNLCAFFAPEKIPTSILKKQIKDDLRFAEMIKILKKYSLIEATAEKISVHRLVQLVTRDHLSKKERQKWISRGILLLNDVFVFHPDYPETWSESSRIAPHAISATAFAEEDFVEMEWTAQLVGNLGTYFQHFAEYEQALSFDERSLHIAEKIYSPNHKEIATAANNLGVLQMILGDFKGAKKYLERALQINESLLGSEHENVAMGASNLGSILRSLGYFTEAKAQLEKAIAIYTKKGVNRHPEITKSLNNLGGVLHDLGDFSGALRQYEQALEIDEKTYGPIHPEVARDVNNIGLILQDWGEPQKAKIQFERSLKINTEVFGQNHPQVAISLNNLGRVMQDLDDLPSARQFLEQSLKIYESKFGSDHPEVARVANNLGVVLEDMDDLEGAKKQIIRAMRIDEKFYGSENIEVATDLNNLGTIFTKMGDFTKAKIQYDRALAIGEKTFGPIHPHNAITLNNLGDLYVQKGELDIAVIYYKKSLNLVEKLYNSDHLDIAKAASRLGEAFFEQGEFVEAERQFEHAYKILSNKLGMESEYTKSVKSHLDFIFRVNVMHKFSEVK